MPGAVSCVPGLIIPACIATVAVIAGRFQMVLFASVPTALRIWDASLTIFKPTIIVSVVLVLMAPMATMAMPSWPITMPVLASVIDTLPVVPLELCPCIAIW